MRFVLLVLFGVGMPVLLSAQYSLDASTSLPRPGDRLIKKQVEYKAPGSKGMQAVWDFSALTTEGKDYKLEYNSNDTIVDKIWGVEHRTSYCYLSRKDSLLLSSYENPTTLIRLRNPETLLTFPLSYGDTFTDYFDGWGNYCNRLSMDIYGKSIVTADGIGTIILPGGDSLQHVLRVHTQKKIAHTVKPFFKDIDNSNHTAVSPDSIEYILAHDSTHLIIDSWRWYAEGYRYPVLETITNRVCNSGSDINHFSTSFYYPPLEQYYALNDDPGNREKRDMQSEHERQKNWMKDAKPEKQFKDELISYAYYSNDERTICLNYTLYEPAEISISLFDFQGRQLSESYPTNKVQGSYNEVFSIENYPTQQFLLRIHVNSRIYGIKIIK